MTRSRAAQLLAALLLGLAVAAAPGVAGAHGTHVAHRRAVRSSGLRHLPASVFRSQARPLTGALPAGTTAPPGSVPPPPGSTDTAPPGTTTTTPGTTTTTTAPLPSRSGAQLVEYSVYLSRTPLAAGPVEIVATNYGMDDHQLDVVDSDGDVVGSTPVLHPQDEATLDLTLPAGTYTLLCPLADHYELGMHTELDVK